MPVYISFDKSAKKRTSAKAFSRLRMGVMDNVETFASDRLSHWTW